MILKFQGKRTDYRMGPLPRENFVMEAHSMSVQDQHNIIIPKVSPKSVTLWRCVVETGHLGMHHGQKARTVAHELVDRLVCENPFNVGAPDLLPVRVVLYLSICHCLHEWNCVCCVSHPTATFIPVGGSASCPFPLFPSEIILIAHIIKIYMEAVGNDAL